ncbi:MAG: inositol monophosphatase [Alphaproteobacteria bacterium]|nr:inositol monophosphatase [Alphaproteobacteria bacterium]
MALHSAVINVMVAAVRKASRGLLRDYGEVDQLQVSLKGPANFVSAADRKADEQLRNELLKARPGWSILTEESGATPGSDSENRWIVDPLDGTTNFLHGLPHFAICIAHERKGEIVTALIHDPLRDETFMAERGAGAFLQDRRLRVSARRALQDALVVTGIPDLSKPDHDLFIARLRNVMASVAGVRRTGSAGLDLAYVAAGRFDGYWEKGLGLWDFAAGTLLVREAGGMVGDVEGNAFPEFQTVVAANDHLFERFVKLLRDADAGRGVVGPHSTG